MKKSSILGYIAAGLALTATIFRMQHWEGASIALCLASASTSIFLFVYVLNVFKVNEGDSNGPAEWIAALCVAMFNIGVLFKLQHWAGASQLLVLGIGGFSVICLPLFMLRKIKNSGSGTIMYGSGALGLAALLLSFLFKLQHWQGAFILMMLSLGLLFLVYAPMLLSNSAMAEQMKAKTFFGFIIGLYAALFFMHIIGQASKEQMSNGLTISAENMHILYVGVDNPLKIALPDMGSENMSVSISEGSITGENGSYMAKVSQPGMVWVKVYHHEQPLDSVQFQVKSVSTDTVAIAGQVIGNGAAVN